MASAAYLVSHYYAAINIPSFVPTRIMGTPGA
jgi:hypothetical protein